MYVCMYSFFCFVLHDLVYAIWLTRAMTRGNDLGCTTVVLNIVVSYENLLLLIASLFGIILLLAVALTIYYYEYYEPLTKSKMKVHQLVTFIRALTTNENNLVYLFHAKTRSFKTSIIKWGCRFGFK